MLGPRAAGETEYRRGALLGLTLAELLLLLLFLFLMIMAALLFEKDEIIESATVEAEAWRQGASQNFQIAPPERPVGYIDPEDMDRPLSELELRAAEAEQARSRAEALTTILREGISEEEVAARLEELQIAAQRLAAIEEELGRPEDIIQRAQAVRPDQSPRMTTLSAIELLQDQSEAMPLEERYAQCTADLAQCRSDQQTIVDQFGATLANLQPGACLRANMNISGLLADGPILHSFDVVLSDQGIFVRDGDEIPASLEFLWYQRWFDEQPSLAREAPYDAAEFVRAFYPFFDRAAVSSPAEEGRDGRPFGNSTLDCRFYVRIYRDSALVDATRSEQLRQAVESVFYKNERGMISLSDGARDD